MSVIHLADTLETLRMLRGETSRPLREEIKLVLENRAHTLARSCAVQVESSLLVKGISLLVDFTQPIVVRLYISRKEIAGFIPSGIKEQLRSQAWRIYNDELGQEFALLYRLFHDDVDDQLSYEITKALETLGAPQKHTWKLHPVYA